MSDDQQPRLDALERLAALYEKGLLTREEFDAQKAALLSEPAPPASEAPETAPAAADAEAEGEAKPAPQRTPSLAAVVLGVSAAIAAVAVGAVVWMLWSRSPPSGPSANTAAAMSAATPGATAAALPATPTLDDAFALAFGAHGSAVKTVTWQHEPTKVRYTPQALIPIPGGMALIARGDVVSAAHVNSGFLGVAYLVPGPTGWTVSGQWPQLVETGSFGEIEGWKPRDDLFDNPGLEVDGGGEWQGCAVGYADLVELTPGLPTVRAPSVLVSFSYPEPAPDDPSATPPNDAGASASVQYGDTTGRILAALKGQTFRVVYDGDFARTVTWSRGALAFTPSANAKTLPGC
ncbi:MAG: SHOCT domain-containing protein [Proteobacteria bacterium]|nr:SHOCT domain-containing protein [Pseudomonadota bacterium]